MLKLFGAAVPKFAVNPELELKNAFINTVINFEIDIQ